MIPLNSNAPNVDNSDLFNYPDGRIKDNSGVGGGTPVNRNVYGDLHSNISRLMRLYGITPNGLPDNETSGYQIIEAIAALASKNDYIYPLTTDGTFLNIQIKLSLMQTNEFLVCLAANDKGAETQIKGSTGSPFAVVYSGNFKANEYVRVIKTLAGVSIIRIADWNSLSQMCLDAGFLQKALQAEEDAGLIDTKATTPLVNKTTFTKRVIGTDSPNYLATAARNGLYPKEHFTIVAAIGANPIKNIGTFTLDVGGSSGGLACDGDISSASATGTAPNSFVTVNMVNAMDISGAHYYTVKYWLESLGSLGVDNTIFAPVFKKVSATQFQMGFHEGVSAAQSIRVHIEVVQR